MTSRDAQILFIENNLGLRRLRYRYAPRSWMAQQVQQEAPTTVARHQAVPG
jgi:hypothetical protein